MDLTSRWPAVGVPTAVCLATHPVVATALLEKQVVGWDMAWLASQPPEVLASRWRGHFSEKIWYEKCMMDWGGDVVYPLSPWGPESLKSRRAGSGRLCQAPRHPGSNGALSPCRWRWLPLSVTSSRICQCCPHGPFHLFPCSTPACTTSLDVCQPGLFGQKARWVLWV